MKRLIFPIFSLIALPSAIHANMTVEQLKTQLSQFGITPDQMFDQMNKTLIRMKDELDKTS